MKIAFTNLCKRDWIAGCHYLKNLFLALKSLPNAPELVLVDTGDTSDESYKMLLPFLDDVLVYPPPRRLVRRIHFGLQNRLGIPLGAHNPMHDLLADNGVDILFTSKSAGEGFGLPQLIWLPDFQHVRLPHLFSADDLAQRDQRYRRWTTDAQRIVLSSHDALNDLQTFAPENVGKARILHFVAHVDPAIYAQSPSFVCELYHIPSRYIYLPNQFWKHKNHAVVLEALAIVKHEHPEITVVCTGNTHDYRQPLYFGELLTRVAQLGIHDQFRMLGMVPHAHIFPLIRQSLAVLQPSYFEGWSTTVEETKSIGKSMILSDIAVHREQNPPQARYFDPDNADQLAQHLLNLYETRQAGADTELEAQAQANFPHRAREFGQAFLAIAQEALAQP